jgi:DNA-binding Lrp family transcriptional regulator
MDTQDLPPRTEAAGRRQGMELDELDRGVVHVLQIHPRAPWTLVGEVLGVNPVTAARRWHRLEEAGLAWVTAYPRLSDSRIVVTGVVEVDTEPGSPRTWPMALAADPAVANVKLTAGGRDLVAAVQTRTSTSWRTSPRSCSSGHRGYGRPVPMCPRRPHRGQPLAAAQPGRGPVRPGRGGGLPSAPERGRSTAGWDSLDARLLELLSTDGRMSMRDLAAAPARPHHGAPQTAVAAGLPGEPALRSGPAAVRLAAVRRVLRLRTGPVSGGDQPGAVRGARGPLVRHHMWRGPPHNLVIDVWLRDLRTTCTPSRPTCRGGCPACVGSTTARWCCARSSTWGAAPGPGRPLRGRRPPPAAHTPREQSAFAALGPRGGGHDAGEGSGEAGGDGGGTPGEAPVEDVIVTTRTCYHLLRFVDTAFDSGVFFYLWLDRREGNLALARLRLRDLSQRLAL